MWLIVLGCFFFWLVAYVLIIVKGFRERTYCMPIAAFCGNVIWEFLFAFVHPSDFLLIRLGNCLWLAFDAVILVTIIKYGRGDFKDSPFMQKWLFVMMAIGTAIAAYVAVSFIEVYNDRLGYSSGWIQAFVMSFLFIAMLLRRDSVRGQSVYIALAIVLGNTFAWLWVAHFPDTPKLDPGLNLTYWIATVSVNIAYAVLIYQKYKSSGLNPWRNWALPPG